MIGYFILGGITILSIIIAVVVLRNQNNEYIFLNHKYEDLKSDFHKLRGEYNDLSNKYAKQLSEHKLTRYHLDGLVDHCHTLANDIAKERDYSAKIYKDWIFAKSQASRYRNLWNKLKAKQKK